MKLIVVSAVGAGLGAGGSALITRLGPTAAQPYRFFRDHEASLVIDLCEQIIPGDDAPGATQAGVVHYLDRQLAGKLARHQATYRDGLAALAQTCLSLEKQPFGALPTARKIEFLQRVEAGAISTEGWGQIAPAAFFSLLIDHTMQGFYGGPRHGGNRDYMSYRMLRIDYPQIIGRTKERKT